MNKKHKTEEKILQIRGIHRRDIIGYVEELGGIMKEPALHSGRHSNTNGTETCTFTGEKWTCTVSKEEYFTFLQSRIPQVDVLFQAKKSEILEPIIKKFRLKTLRGGG